MLGAVPSPTGREGPTVAELRRLCVLAADCAGVHDGHMAIEFVDAARIADQARRSAGLSSGASRWECMS